MSKGNILIESIVSLMIVIFMVQMTLISIRRTNDDTPSVHLIDQLNKDCDFLCALKKDSH